MPLVTLTDFRSRIATLPSRTVSSVQENRVINYKTIKGNSIYYDRGGVSTAQMDINVMYDCYKALYGKYSTTRAISGAEIKDILPKSYNAHYSFFMVTIDAMQLGELFRALPATLTLI